MLPNGKPDSRCCVSATCLCARTFPFSCWWAWCWYHRRIDDCYSRATTSVVGCCHGRHQRAVLGKPFPTDTDSSYQATSSYAWLFAAGLCFGLAVATRWAYALVAPAFAAYMIRQIRLRRLSARHAIVPVVGGLLIFLPQLWLSLDKPEGLLHPWLVSWSLDNFFRRQFETLDGLATYTLPIGLFFSNQPAIPPTFSLCWGWPVCGVAGNCGAEACGTPKFS